MAENPWAFGWSAIEAIAVAATALYAWLQISDNRKFNRRRLTVDLFDSSTSTTFTDTINSIRIENQTLTNARTYVMNGWAQNPVPAILAKQTNEVLGTLGYAGVLYCNGTLDDDIFLARAHDFVASAFYIFEPIIAVYIRAGGLDQTVVKMAQDCLQYRRDVPRTFDPSPELHTYSIPDNFPGP